MIAKVDLDGLTVGEVVEEWMAGNPATWKPWIGQ
jgi:ABC-type proline/glycine betaine transport system substrate-binding protein